MRKYSFLLTARRTGSAGVSGQYAAERTAESVELAVQALYTEFDHIDVINVTHILIDGVTAWPHIEEAWDGYGLLRAVYTKEWPAGQQPPALQLGESNGIPAQRQYPEKNIFVMTETGGFLAPQHVALRWDGEAWFHRDGKPCRSAVWNWEDTVHHTRREYTPETAK